MVMRKVALTMMGLVLMASVPLFGFAEEMDTVEIKSKDLTVSEFREEQINKIGEEIMTQLNEKTVDEYEQVIANASAKKKKDIEKIYDGVFFDAIMDNEDVGLERLETSNEGISTLEIDEASYQQLTSTYRISDIAAFEISPLYISLEIVGSGLDSSDPSLLDLDARISVVEPASTTKSTNGYSTKVYYSGGTKIATAKVNCNFYYNGTKAWYKSGLKGSLKINAPANWKRLSGNAYRSQYSSSEKSYWAYYNGKVAQYGELWGGAVPVKLKTVLVQAGVVCSKTGYITTKNTAYDVRNNY